MHGAVWTIIYLDEDIMVLNNVNKFHKILIKRADVIGVMYERRHVQMYGQTYGWTGVTLNAPAIVMAGA